MNIISLKNNIVNCLKSTDGFSNAFKKLWWIYDLDNKLSLKRIKQRRITFRFERPIGNLTIQVRNNKGSDAFILSEVFQHFCYWLSFDFPVKYIVDLGANAGYSTIFFSRIFPEASIACVEPMPENISILKQNLSLNAVHALVVEAAISVTDDKIEMELNEKDYGHKVHGISYGKQFAGQTLTVNGISMDSLLRELAWPRIDVLKIDIEGYESILLTQGSGWLAYVGTIIMELHEGITIETIKQITDKYFFKYVEQRKGNWIISKCQIR